jgi:hypothetical protein
VAIRPKKRANNKPKPGPKPEVLKLEGDGKENFRKPFQNAKPAKG